MNRGDVECAVILTTNLLVIGDSKQQHLKFNKKQKIKFEENF